LEINIESQAKWLTLKNGVTDSFVQFWYSFLRNWCSDALLVSIEKERGLIMQHLICSN